MKIKLVSVWQFDLSIEDIVSDIDQYDYVIVDNPVETYYNLLGSDTNGLVKLIKCCKDKNVPIIVLTSTVKYNNILDFNDPMLSDANVIDMPGFWIWQALHETAPNRDIGDCEVFNNNCCLNKPIEHLYITMNNRAHQHRCMMMDLLAKYDLIDRGAISWRGILHNFEGLRNDMPVDICESEIIKYPYRYWKPKRMYLDIPYTTSSHIIHRTIPTQYNNSFMQLVAESEVDDFFLSEKTAIPLLFNKMFLVVGSKNFHSNLVDMGFKLYDSVFDYSFDSLEDSDDRTELVIQNINRYRNCSNIELEQIIKQNEDVIQHNRKLALDYVFNIVPNQVKPVFELLSENNIESRYDMMKSLEYYKQQLY